MLCLQYLGWHNPLADPASTQTTSLNAPAIKKWLECGALPSDRVRVSCALPCHARRIWYTLAVRAVQQTSQQLHNSAALRGEPQG